MRTYGINQVFRFGEGNWPHRKSSQIRNFVRKRPILLNTCATCSELPSYISTVDNIREMYVPGSVRTWSHPESCSSIRPMGKELRGFRPRFSGPVFAKDLPQKPDYQRSGCMLQLGLILISSQTGSGEKNPGRDLPEQYPTIEEKKKTNMGSD